MAENQENQEHGNDPQFGKQGGSQSDRQGSDDKGGQNFGGSEEQQKSSQTWQPGGEGTGTQTARTDDQIDDQTGEPGLTPGREVGEDSPGGGKDF